MENANRTNLRFKFTIFAVVLVNDVSMFIVEIYRFDLANLCYEMNLLKPKKKITITCRLVSAY